jgi:uncharacterized protein YdeI (YjbR/CyaY-like superfamily)
MIPVSAEIRGITGVAGGDELDVDVELDTEPRELRLPTDFAEALDADPEARRFFDRRSYGNRQRMVIPIEQARTPETRRRRIANSIDSLRPSESRVP